MFIDKATRHVMMKQGVLGIRLKIMLPHDPEGKNGPKTPFPDNVSQNILCVVRRRTPENPVCRRETCFREPKGQVAEWRKRVKPRAEQSIRI